MAHYVHDVHNANYTDRIDVLHGRSARTSGNTSLLQLGTALARKTQGAARPSQGILHGQARQHLGQLVFYIFVPCLTFTKLASSVDLNNLKIWWPLPVNTALR